MANAAEHSVPILTGDKRALQALAKVSGFADALAGRIVTLEGVLLALCNEFGDGHVRAAVQPLLPIDKTVQVCFSSGNPSPRVGLRSYFDSLKREVPPLILWEPPSECDA